MILMNDMHPLGRLIKEAMDRNEWSYRTLEERSARAGHRMSHTNFQRLRDHEVRSIKGEVVRMLASVLGRSEQVVAGAVLESMGIDLPGAQSASLIDVVRTSNEISEYDQHLLESLLVVMTERQSNEQQEDQPEELPDNVREGRFRASRKEQKIPDGIAAYDRELGDGFQPGTIPED